MLSWSTIVSGAALSALVAATVVGVFVRPRQVPVIVTATFGALLGPLAWNAVLHDVGGSDFFHDAPLAVMPASWQDAGSGVFAVAVATVVLGFGPARNEAARRAAALALLCGLGAFLVDVYLY